MIGMAAESHFSLYKQAKPSQPNLKEIEMEKKPLKYLN